MSENKDQEKKVLPPYVSWRTFVNFLDSLGVTVPSQIDRSVVPSMSGGTWSYLIGALRFMNLVDSNNIPSEALKLLAGAKGDKRKDLYKELFDSTYSFLLENGVDISQTTPNQLQKALNDAGATGDTASKCRSFFLSLAKEAGIQLSPYLMRVSRQVPTTKRRVKKKTTTTTRRSRERDLGNEDMSQKLSPHEVLYGILDPELMSEEEQKAVWTLMMYLKKQEVNE